MICFVLFIPVVLYIGQQDLRSVWRDRDWSVHVFLLDWLYALWKSGFPTEATFYFSTGFDEGPNRSETSRTLRKSIRLRTSHT